ncbi:f5143d85-58c2-4ae2-bdaa-1099ebfe96d6 [Sclerotinia trifoliorum]|uniref:F5143d85-58c2-4ae2-bdaa-1099ebfe96d6 n=1 Tax=Sclerotinia trifoliorum TaxID=28548 RepID=A0A8H2ZKU0_9HELO|nr:f5143d85-58c2-4ae2-bdaa-1099ebfe96d6 [Sclerotinia trifoliorum]
MSDSDLYEPARTHAKITTKTSFRHCKLQCKDPKISTLIRLYSRTTYFYYLRLPRPSNEKSRCGNIISLRLTHSSASEALLDDERHIFIISWATSLDVCPLLAFTTLGVQFLEFATPEEDSIGELAQSLDGVSICRTHIHLFY